MLNASHSNNRVNSNNIINYQTKNNIISMVGLWLILVIWIGGIFGSAQPCSPEDIEYEMSPCVNGKVRIVFNWKSQKCFKEPQEPLELDCPKCPINMEASFDLKNKSLTFQDCSEDFYNSAGTLKYSSELKNWWDIDMSIKLLAKYGKDMVSMSEYDNVVWRPNNDFSLLELNPDFVVPSKVNFIQAKLVVNLVEPGYISFKFKMNADNRNGGLNVLVNKKVEYSIIKNSSPMSGGKIKITKFPNF